MHLSPNYYVVQVGIIAANDGVLLRNQIPRMLKKHFKGKPYYVDLLDLFNEVIYISKLSDFPFL